MCDLIDSPNGGGTVIMSGLSLRDGAWIGVSFLPTKSIRRGMSNDTAKAAFGLSPVGAVTEIEFVWLVWYFTDDVQL
jgi:hypothetical protein